MVVQRRRRWANIKPELVQRLVFAAIVDDMQTVFIWGQYVLDN